MKFPDNDFADFDPFGAKHAHSPEQFDQLEATVLFCSQCKEAVPVRKRLLLALPEGDKYDYLCVYCGNSVGTKIEGTAQPIKLLL
ncbi:MAG TPA: cytoplasmic protein [Thermodesulfobacteriota bacterium]|nr:cytoplasmic protein [Thermodesulfobacteriota bacterium]